MHGKIEHTGGKSTVPNGQTTVAVGTGVRVVIGKNVFVGVSPGRGVGVTSSTHDTLTISPRHDLGGLSALKLNDCAIASEGSSRNESG